MQRLLGALHHFSQKAVSQRTLFCNTLDTREMTAQKFMFKVEL